MAYAEPKEKGRAYGRDGAEELFVPLEGFRDDGRQRLSGSLGRAHGERGERNERCEGWDEVIGEQEGDASA